MKCIICKDKFDPVVEDQHCCTMTCARVAQRPDELGRVKAELAHQLEDAVERKFGKGGAFLSWWPQ